MLLPLLPLWTAMRPLLEEDGIRVHPNGFNPVLNRFPTVTMRAYSSSVCRFWVRLRRTKEKAG